MNDEIPSSVTLSNIKKRPAVSGKQWLFDAWKLFKLSPITWVSTIFIMSFLMLIVVIIPVVNIFAAAVSTLFLGGLMYGIAEVKNGKPFQLGYLFKGFDVQAVNLIVAGALYLGGTIICSLIAFNLAAFLGFQVMEVPPEDILNGSFDAKAYLESLLVPMLLFMALLVPVLMAYWFVPALIVIEKIKPVEAFKLSFVACQKNIASFTIFGFAGILALVGLLAISQVLILLIPQVAFFIMLFLNMSFLSVIVASIYTSYDDIFDTNRAANFEESSNNEPPNQITL